MDIDKLIENQKMQDEFDRLTEESIYIIQDYGIQAWYDLGAFKNYNEAKITLEQMNESLERREKYEECALIRDIKTLF